MQKIDLDVSVRVAGSKGAARTLRAKDAVPAVFYGPGLKASLSLSVERKAMDSLVRSKSPRSSLITLKNQQQAELDGSMAVLKDWQFHPVTRELLHVDFLRVTSDHALTLSIPVVFTGKAVGLTNGGIMDIIRRSVTITCLPADLISELEVDVSKLNVGDTLKIKDLAAHTGVRIVESQDEPLVSIVLPAKEETAAPVAAAAATTAAPAAAAATAAPAKEEPAKG